MFEQTQKEFIKNFLDKNPVVDVEEILTALENSGLSKSKTRKQSYNRALNEVLKEDGVVITKEKPKTKDTVIQTQDGISKRSDDDFARDDFIDTVIDEDDTGIWYKKILKTGSTKNPLWKTSQNIEAVTFEKNDKVRFEKMLQAIQNSIPEISYIDEAGYDQNSTTEFMVDDEAQYPRIKVNLTSGSNTSTEIVIAD